jgi:MoxR-like ATPase
MTDAELQATLTLGHRLDAEVLDSLKRTFVEKDEIIDLLGVCLVGGENLFIMGPPGTAKSALVQELGRHLGGQTFEYLLTRFTEPGELFGPFDIRKLREGDLVSNTEGMLPEADLVFLDELLNANSAILNSLLTVLNERVFRRGRETRPLPTLMVVGASNSLPEEEALGALFDRFLMRVRCDNVPAERLGEVLQAGWELDLKLTSPRATFSVDDLRRLRGLLPRVDLSPVRPRHLALVERLRLAGIPVSDRRAVKLQRLLAASALLCGRQQAHPTDLWIMRYIWDTEEQQEILAALVEEELARAREVTGGADLHPRSREPGAPDPEALARDLERLEEQIDTAPPEVLRDRLGILAGRVPWVPDEPLRQQLETRIETLWTRLGT